MGYVDPERARAYERDKYWRRRNDGLCVKCGKRYADAGHCMCRSCGMAAKALKQKAQTILRGLTSAIRIARCWEFVLTVGASLQIRDSAGVSRVENAGRSINR